jgi:hypothetical protein
VREASLSDVGWPFNDGMKHEDSNISPTFCFCVVEYYLSTASSTISVVVAVAVASAISVTLAVAVAQRLAAAVA